MLGHGVIGYGAKIDLLQDLVRERSVLHLGAVGETCQALDRKLGGGSTSVHACLTAVARECIGIDTDAQGVEALREAGTFDNLLVADATRLSRQDIPLKAIDFVVAGDIIEHLSDPGKLLDTAAQICDPQTKLVITTPNALGLPGILRYIRGDVLEGPDHKLSFNVYTLRNLLAHHGWKVESIQTCHQRKATNKHSGLTMKTGVLFFKKFPALGGTLFIIARHDSRS